MTTQIWAHVNSGERYIVVLDITGAVVEAAGPLHYKDIEIVLRDGFDSDGDLVDDLNAAPDQYRRTDDQV